MLLSRVKITRDGRLVTKDDGLGNKKTKDTMGTVVLRKGGYSLIEGVGTDGGWFFVTGKGENEKFKSKSQAEEYIDNCIDEDESTDSFCNQDSISEGAKIVVNTDNHVNESAIAVTINESDCLVRFENGDEETVPIEAVSAFESMANDGVCKDADISEEIKKYEEALKKAKEEGNDEKILRIERLISQLKEDSKYNDSETESQIAELTKNMDAAKRRGYDTAPYQKEIDRLKSLDENNGYVEISPETGGYDISVYQNGNKIKSTWKSDQSSARQAANIFADYYRDDNGQSLTIKFKGKDKYTGDPLTAKGQEIMASLKEQYGEEKGEQVFYAMKNSGQIEGID